MTLHEKVGKLFAIRLESLLPAGDWSAVTEITPEIRKQHARYPAGGYILFEKNIVGAEQLKKLTADIHALEGAPLVFVDEEGGIVARLARRDLLNLPRYPNAAEMAKRGEAAVYEQGKTIGAYLKAFGIDGDFAPVADVNSNPTNPVIGTRSFSDVPETVTRMVKAFLGGLHENGILGCTKHFPGHGDTRTDSHKEAAFCHKCKEALYEMELQPFRDTVHDTDLVMTGHISLPLVPQKGEGPASLSRDITTGILREELGFRGVIVTDALEMKAVTKFYTAKEAAVLAIEAGADLLLMPEDYVSAYEGVVEAVRAGRISQERIDESLRRIDALRWM